MRRVQMLGGFFNRLGMLKESQTLFDLSAGLYRHDGKLEGMRRLSEAGRARFVGEYTHCE